MGYMVIKLSFTERDPESHSKPVLLNANNFSVKIRTSYESDLKRKV